MRAGLIMGVAMAVNYLWSPNLSVALILSVQLLNSPYLISSHLRLGATIMIALFTCGVLLTPTAAVVYHTGNVNK